MKENVETMHTAKRSRRMVFHPRMVSHKLKSFRSAFAIQYTCGVPNCWQHTIHYRNGGKVTTSMLSS